MRTHARYGVVLGVVAMLLVGGCSDDDDSGDEGSRRGLPRGSEQVTLDPDEFSLEITNPYWPMDVGDRWVYEETDAEGEAQRVEVTVLEQTKTVRAGVQARVVHDVVSSGGEVVEDTYDWYAQDGDGNIWYLGEDTTEYENGEAVSTEGSWEAGVDGAQAGILIPAEPRPGMTYRQEYLEDEAEDNATVLSVREMVEVSVGRFDDVLMTRETTPLEPEVEELKFYARGVGPLLALQVSGGTGREELVETNRSGN